MKKAIVTGGLGFIGSNLIELLLKKNFYVINIDKVSYSSNYYNVKEFKKNSKYQFIKCDLNNQKKIFNIIKKNKPSVIFNLAADTHVDRSIEAPRTFIKNNISGVYSLLESFRKYYSKFKKIILIHVSTDEVFGDVEFGRSKENNPYRPSSPYAASKASSDHLVFSYIKTFKIPAIITNCSNNYGPKQHPEKLIPKIIYNSLNNLPIPIYGNGRNSREWIYVQDHCEALLKIFYKGKIGNFYNIGSNYNLSNINLTKIIISIIKKNFIYKRKIKIIFVKDRPGHDLRYALDSTKIKKELKWKVKTNIIQGLKKTINWYLENPKYYSGLNKKDITKRLGKLS